MRRHVLANRKREKTVIHVLGEVAMQVRPTFIDVFATAGAAAHARHGCQGAEVFSVADDAQRIVVLLT